MMPGFEPDYTLLPPDCGPSITEAYNNIGAMAPYPNSDYARAAPLSLNAGICGRAFNISNTGFNSYDAVVGDTGTGKEAMASGISKIMTAVQGIVPGSADFRGPGELVSSPGLIKWLEKKPSCLSIVGELGIFFAQITSPKASPHHKSLERTLLQLYGKSGHGNSFDASAHSDKENGTGVILNPSYSLLGETTGSSLYPHLNDSQISSGVLTRFNFHESKKRRSYENRERLYSATDDCVKAVADLAAQALNIGRSGKPQIVQLDSAANDLWV